MMNMPDIDLTFSDWQELVGILRRHVPAYSVAAFGSRAKWLAKPYSDLDLVIMTTVPLSLAQMVGIKEAFDESDLTVRVDVLDWAATDKTFQEMIAKDRVIIQRPFEPNGKQLWMAWRLSEIGRIVDVVPGKVAASGQQPADTCVLPWVRSADFSVIPANAVLVCCSGAGAGRVALATTPCQLTGQVVAMIVNADKWSYEFIYYNLLSRQQELRLLVEDVAQPVASKTALSALWVSCPALVEQNRVVAILRLQDQRIALLHEMNATLAAMLETTLAGGCHQQLATLLSQRIAENKQQAILIATLRDTLLPRLIAGQLRLPEVQAQIEETIS